MTTAIGCTISSPAMSPKNSMGKKVTPMAVTLVTVGPNRCRAPRRTSSGPRASPSCCSRDRQVLTNKMAWRAATPSTASNPASEPRETVPPAASYRQHAARERPQQAHVEQRRKQPALEARLQQQIDPDGSSQRSDGSLPVGRLPLRVVPEKHGMVFERKFHCLQLFLDVPHDGTQVASRDVGADVGVEGEALAVNDCRRRLHDHLGHIRQAHAAAAGRVDQELAKIREALAGFGYSPDHHFEDLLLFVQIADFKATEHGGSRPSDIARLQPDPTGRRKVHLDRHMRRLDRVLHAQVGDAVDSRKDLRHLLRLAPQPLLLGPLDAHHDGIACSRQPFFHLGGEVALHFAVEAGVSLDRFADGGERRAIAGVGIDVDPKLPQLDVGHLIPGDGTADVGG